MSAIPQQSILAHHKSFYLRYFSGKRLVWANSHWIRSIML